MDKPEPAASTGTGWEILFDRDASENQHVPAGLEEVVSPVPRMEALLRAWAVGFAARRSDVAGHQLTVGARGLHPDECASFLRALDAGQLHVDSAGYVLPLAARPKNVGGRYALCCKSGAGVTVNTEYIIQLGALGELVTEWKWDPRDLQVEMTEFDIAGFAPGGRVALTVEAKTRVPGADGLEKLLNSLLTLTKAPPPQPIGNAERKYLRLLRFCQSGPVVLWLVAAGARWAFLAVRSGDRLTLTPTPAVGRTEAGDLRSQPMTSSSPPTTRRC